VKRGFNSAVLASDILSNYRAIAGVADELIDESSLYMFIYTQ